MESDPILRWPKSKKFTVEKKSLIKVCLCLSLAFKEGLLKLYEKPAVFKREHSIPVLKKILYSTGTVISSFSFAGHSDYQTHLNPDRIRIRIRRPNWKRFRIPNIWVCRCDFLKLIPFFSAWSWMARVNSALSVLLFYLQARAKSCSFLLSPLIPSSYLRVSL
jgi:hypothetical protein